MKKLYIIPTTVCVEVNCESLLADGSMHFKGSNDNGGTVYTENATSESLSRSQNSLWDDID